MREIKHFLIALVLAVLPVSYSSAADIATDMEDPLFIEGLGNFSSKTSASVGEYFQAREIVAYGFSDRFSISADVRYRKGSNDDTDCFSNVGVLGTYRVGDTETGLTDVLVGFGFGGQGVVPNYTDEVYSVGVKTGKQWSGLTLAATVLTSWFFDDKDGIAYIDFSPEAYFRMQGEGDWSFGLGMTFRKSTTDVFDQEWINAKFGSTIGRTGWFMNFGYELEEDEFRVGGTMNMLF